MALGLKVVGPTGALPTTEESLKRNAWNVLNIVPIVGGLIVFVIDIIIGVNISGDPYGRGLHDNFAGGTMVTKAT